MSRKRSDHNDEDTNSGAIPPPNPPFLPPRTFSFSMGSTSSPTAPPPITFEFGGMNYGRDTTGTNNSKKESNNTTSANAGFKFGLSHANSDGNNPLVGATPPPWVSPASDSVKPFLFGCAQSTDTSTAPTTSATPSRGFSFEPSPQLAPNSSSSTGSVVATSFSPNNANGVMGNVVGNQQPKASSFTFSASSGTSTQPGFATFTFGSTTTNPSMPSFTFSTSVDNNAGNAKSADPAEGWKCPTCTFVNDGSPINCLMCGHPNYSSAFNHKKSERKESRSNHGSKSSSVSSSDTTFGKPIARHESINTFKDPSPAFGKNTKVPVKLIVI